MKDTQLGIDDEMVLVSWAFDFKLITSPIERWHVIEVSLDGVVACLRLEHSSK